MKRYAGGAAAWLRVGTEEGALDRKLLVFIGSDASSVVGCSIVLCGLFLENEYGKRYGIVTANLEQR